MIAWSFDGFALRNRLDFLFDRLMNRSAIRLADLLRKFNRK